MAEQAYEPRLKTEYKSRIRGVLKEQFGWDIHYPVFALIVFVMITVVLGIVSYMNHREYSDQAAAMAELTPMERTAFTLRHMEDIPMAEIAAALNITTNSAKQAVFRAVSKLRRSLTPIAGGLR